MGWFSSDEEVTETKMVDSNGQVNNNIIIQEAKDTHNQMLINEKLLMATYWLVAAEILKLGLYCFQTFRRMLKKKYQPTGNNNNGA